MNKILYLLLFCTLFSSRVKSQNLNMETYCNPINIDYTYMIYNSVKDVSYRSGADAAVVKFRGEFYMFVTRSLGYWHSYDLQNWDFITPKNWYFAGSNAPAAHNFKDSVLYVTGDPSGNMNIIWTDDPKAGEWNAGPTILYDLQDPYLFIDDDDQAYIFWGSSNLFPIRGRKLDFHKRFIPNDSIVSLFSLNPEDHGWERFGENHSDTTLGGFIEGAWLTKHNNKYYMEYASPGTEFNVYGDGVYVADHPLGPYTYQSHNPVSYKPGGYINGAGHGSNVIGPGNKYWHFATMDYSVNVNWERRICMYPTDWDKDGIMYTDNYFGDYPHYSPSYKGKHGEFRGWMLLSYNKPVSASSELDSNMFPVKALTDEKAKTSWVAVKNNDKQWVEIDLQSESNINAIQINYSDYKSNLYGKVPNLYQRYTIEGSLDGKIWFNILDKRDSYRDTPNDYVELEKTINARYVRYNNIYVPTPYLGISEIRIFGLGKGQVPNELKNVVYDRLSDKRDIHISWERQNNAQGYNIRWGISPDKLYSSWMVYEDTSLLIKSLNRDQIYYFAVESFNENGVSKLSEITKIP